MLYLYGYLPMHCYTATLLAAVETVAFVVGLGLQLPDHNKTDTASIAITQTAPTAQLTGTQATLGDPLVSLEQLMLRSSLMTGFAIVLGYLVLCVVCKQAS